MAKVLERSQVLYDTDLLAWAERQAAHLRAGQLDRLDVEHLIEELEAMAGKLRRELKNRLRVLLAHLLKWQAQPKRRSRSWAATIAEQRDQIDCTAGGEPEPPAGPGRDCPKRVSAGGSIGRDRDRAAAPRLPARAALRGGADSGRRSGRRGDLTLAAWGGAPDRSRDRGRERMSALAAHRGREPAAAHGPGAALAVRPHGPARARGPGAPGRRVRPRGGAAPPVRSVLVPGVRLRARLRLALERRHHHGVRRAQGGGARPPGGLRPVRRRRQGRHLAPDARRDHGRLRGPGARAGAAGQGEPARRQGRQHRGAGRPPALPPQLRVHAVRQLVRGAAGHVGRHPDRAPLSLAERRPRELRRRAARRGVLRCARRAAEHGREPRARRRAPP